MKIASKGLCYRNNELLLGLRLDLWSDLVFKWCSCHGLELLFCDVAAKGRRLYKSRVLATFHVRGLLGVGVGRSVGRHMALQRQVGMLTSVRCSAPCCRATWLHKIMSYRNVEAIRKLHCSLTGEVPSAIVVARV